PEACSGKEISWRFYAKDKAGNWNSTEIKKINIVEKGTPEEMLLSFVKEQRERKKVNISFRVRCNWSYDPRQWSHSGGADGELLEDKEKGLMKVSLKLHSPSNPSIVKYELYIRLGNESTVPILWNVPGFIPHEGYNLLLPGMPYAQCILREGSYSCKRIDDLDSMKEFLKKDEYLASQLATVFTFVYGIPKKLWELSLESTNITLNYEGATNISGESCNLIELPLPKIGREKMCIPIENETVCRWRKVPAEGKEFFLPLVGRIFYQPETEICVNRSLGIVWGKFYVEWATFSWWHGGVVNGQWFLELEKRMHAEFLLLNSSEEVNPEALVPMETPLEIANVSYSCEDNKLFIEVLANKSLEGGINIFIYPYQLNKTHLDPTLFNTSAKISTFSLNAGERATLILENFVLPSKEDLLLEVRYGSYSTYSLFSTSSCNRIGILGVNCFPNGKIELRIEALSPLIHSRRVRVALSAQTPDECFCYKTALAGALLGPAEIPPLEKGEGYTILSSLYGSPEGIYKVQVNDDFYGNDTDYCIFSTFPYEIYVWRATYNPKSQILTIPSRAKETKYNDTLRLTIYRLKEKMPIYELKEEILLNESSWEEVAVSVLKIPEMEKWESRNLSFQFPSSLENIIEPSDMLIFTFENGEGQKLEWCCITYLCRTSVRGYPGTPLGGFNIPCEE
ncbi:hypothetical protein DRN63_04490, partial [Nanoarchaeota archaeon]